MADEVFRHDGYMSEFEAGVVSVDGDEVVLDCTAFYPGGGGQVCDTGTINGARVTDVHYSGKEIVHVVPGNSLRPGTRVWCSVDWDRRFDLMMGHTAEHLLFCSMHRQDPDLAIAKIYISPDDKYVVVNHDVPWEKLRAALDFANGAIRDNLTVTKTTMSRDDPDLAEVRIKLDRIPEDEEITVVSIGDIDRSACSGVHVAETSELGMIFVNRKVSAGKDGVAIHFKVGREAMEAAAGLALTCLEACDAAASKPEDIVRAVANSREALRAAEDGADEAARRQLASLEPEVRGDVPAYFALLGGAGRRTLSDAAERAVAEGGVAAFVSLGAGASVMLASGTPKVDCGKVLPEILKMFGGRGGGKPGLAQGGIPDRSEGADALDELRKAVLALLRIRNVPDGEAPPSCFATAGPAGRRRGGSNR